MKKKFKKNIVIKNKLKFILDGMVPGDKYMPSFTNAVNINKLIKIISYRDDFKNIKMNIKKKSDIEFFEVILGDTVLETYFTSNLVIKALELRKKNYLKNTKKEDIYKLLSKSNNKKILTKKIDA